MGIANLAINGSNLAYAYLVLLQISIVYLQRPNQIHRVHGRHAEMPAFYSIAMGFIGTCLNWVSWLLSAYVAKVYSIPSGVLFFIVGMGASLIANVLVPRLQQADWIGHIISIPATIFLVRAILLSIGIPTSF